MFLSNLASAALLALCAKIVLAVDFIVLSPTMPWDRAGQACEANGWRLARVTPENLDKVSRVLKQSGFESAWVASFDGHETPKETAMLVRVGSGCCEMSTVAAIPRCSSANCGNTHVAVCEVPMKTHHVQSKKSSSSSCSDSSSSSSSSTSHHHRHRKSHKKPRKVSERQYSDSWETSHVPKEIKTMRPKRVKHRVYKHSQSSSTSSTSVTCNKPVKESQFSTVKVIRPHKIHKHERKIEKTDQVLPQPTEPEVIRHGKRDRSSSSSSCSSSQKHHQGRPHRSDTSSLFPSKQHAKREYSYDTNTSSSRLPIKHCPKKPHGLKVKTIVKKKCVEPCKKPKKCHNKKPYCYWSTSSSSMSKCKRRSFVDTWTSETTLKEIIIRKPRYHSKKPKCPKKKHCKNSSSSSNSSCSPECVKSWTTKKIIRPHKIRHHRKHVKIVESVSTTTSESVFEKSVERCPRPKPCRVLKKQKIHRVEKEKPCPKKKCPKKQQRLYKRGVDEVEEKKPKSENQLKSKKYECHGEKCVPKSQCRRERESQSWETSEVTKQIVVRKACRPHHNTYGRKHCRPSSSSSDSSCSSSSVYTTVKIVRPHKINKHHRKVNVREYVESLSTETEVVRFHKKCPPCPKKKPTKKRLYKRSEGISSSDEETRRGRFNQVKHHSRRHPEHQVIVKPKCETDSPTTTCPKSPKRRHHHKKRRHCRSQRRPRVHRSRSRSRSRSRENYRICFSSSTVEEIDPAPVRGGCAKAAPPRCYRHHRRFKKNRRERRRSRSFSLSRDRISSD